MSGMVKKPEEGSQNRGDCGANGGEGLAMFGMVKKPEEGSQNRGAYGAHIGDGPPVSMHSFP